MRKNKERENDQNYAWIKNEKDKKVMRIKSRNKTEYFDYKIRN